MFSMNFKGDAYVFSFPNSKWESLSEEETRLHASASAVLAIEKVTL